MTNHEIATREAWLAAREQLLAREREHTRLGDELAQRRRELPWVSAANTDFNLDFGASATEEQVRGITLQ